MMMAYGKTSGMTVADFYRCAERRRDGWGVQGSHPAQYCTPCTMRNQSQSPLATLYDCACHGAMHNTSRVILFACLAALKLLQ